MTPSRRLSRRAVLAAAGLAAASTAARAGAPPPPVSARPFDAATLIVAGLSGGGEDDWAEWLAPVLGPALFPGLALRKDVVGGLDGVTAANQFEAWAVPDGSTALLLPGAAVMAWLTGDPRAKFDAGHWVPALAATGRYLVMSRVPLPQLLAGPRLRLAAGSPGGVELPAMLALDMLEARWRPVFGVDNPAAALAEHQVDAVVLSGRRVADAARALAASGAAPLFTLGIADEAGKVPRDPDAPDVPTAHELLAERTPNERLLAGWRATAAAATLDMATVLPQLTPATMVAQWRWACAQAAAAGVVQGQAALQGVRPLPAPAATASVSAALADTAALLELRRWLATRLDYRPA